MVLSASCDIFCIMLILYFELFIQLVLVDALVRLAIRKKILCNLLFYGDLASIGHILQGTSLANGVEDRYSSCI